ncbi:methyltransferase domain-containing protein [Streptomyces beijiangensis]
MLEGVNGALFAAAAIGEQDRVLDIGCGSGFVTRTAARRARYGRVVGIDISYPLLERARTLTPHSKLPHLSFVLGDAQVHPFPEGGFDVAISRGGVMFFADPTKAFTNIGRALRPGGRLAFVCPQPAAPDGEEARALALLTSLLGQQVVGNNELGRAMASLSDPEHVREVLWDAGFRNVSVTPLATETVWGRDADDAVSFFLSRSPGRTVPGEVRERMRAAFLPYEQGERGVRMGAGVWVVGAERS